MKVAIGLDAKVTRGAESWQFFAFVFAAVLTLVFSLLEESYRFHARVVWQRMGIKTLVFAFCFYIFMRNDYVRNKLARVSRLAEDGEIETPLSSKPRHSLQFSKHLNIMLKYLGGLLV
jgi:hypothetical protein